MFDSYEKEALHHFLLFYCAYVLAYDGRAFKCLGFKEGSGTEA